MTFSDKSVKAEKPNPGQTKPRDVRENQGDGFGLTVFPSGKKSFIFFYHFAGRKRRMTIGQYPHCSLAEAKRIHRAALSLLESGNDPALERHKSEQEARNASTVKWLVDEYLDKWAKPRKRTWQEDQRILYKDIIPIWGKRKANDIARREVIDLLDRIKDRGAPIIANRTLATIRRMFNFAIERDIIPHSPCVMVKAVAKENRRDRCLTEDEIKALWLALNHASQAATSNDDIKMSEATKLALKLQLVTAQRKGEIVRIEWSDIQLNDRWWTIPAAKAKNGVLTRVYLSNLAMGLLTRIKELSGDSKWAFPAPSGETHITPDSISRAINRSTFDGLEHFTPHDLRRTAATHMCAIGIPRLVVSKILNHVDNSITAIYDRHSYDTEKTNAIEAWGRKLGQIIGGGAANNASNVINFAAAAKIKSI
jgi:integrase